MNRTERLYALVEELRARSPRLIGAQQLAKHFEVTTRTVERDLLALQEAGVPIWAQPGPGGGYSLHADTTLPPLRQPWWPRRWQPRASCRSAWPAARRCRS